MRNKPRLIDWCLKAGHVVVLGHDAVTHVPVERNEGTVLWIPAQPFPTVPARRSKGAGRVGQASAFRGRLAVTGIALLASGTCVAGTFSAVFTWHVGVCAALGCLVIQTKKLATIVNGAPRHTRARSPALVTNERVRRYVLAAVLRTISTRCAELVHSRPNRSTEFFGVGARICC